MIEEICDGKRLGDKCQSFVYLFDPLCFCRFRSSRFMRVISDKMYSRAAALQEFVIYERHSKTFIRYAVTRTYVRIFIDFENPRCIWAAPEKSRRANRLGAYAAPSNLTTCSRANGTSIHVRIMATSSSYRFLRGFPWCMLSICLRKSSWRLQL